MVGYLGLDECVVAAWLVVVDDGSSLWPAWGGGEGRLTSLGALSPSPFPKTSMHPNHLSTRADGEHACQTARQQR